MTQTQKRKRKYVHKQATMESQRNVAYSKHKKKIKKIKNAIERNYLVLRYSFTKIHRLSM